MILLDTNVLSEPTKPMPDARVIAWLDAQHASTLYTTAINELELRAGVASLPPGRRRSVLERAVDMTLHVLIGSHILAFDSAAVAECASRWAAAQRVGQTVLLADAQIAAIAAAHGFTVATRDTKAFLAMGVPVINPWEP